MVIRSCLRTLRGAVLIFFMGFVGNVFAGDILQIPAFLPTVDSVPATEPMPLDGTWLITSIGKKVRIQSGRAYAIDGWLHLFTLKIAPGMVVIQNISPTGPGKYSGDDLPLAGKWSAKVQANRNLSVTVAGLLGSVNYTMVPVQLDNPQWFAQEMVAAGLSAPTVSEQPIPPVYTPAPPPSTQPIPRPIPPQNEDEYEGEYEGEYEDEYEDEYEEEGADNQATPDPSQPEEKILATDHGAYACRGKNLYFSKGNCYSCPSGYTRFSITRKMTHAKACTLRQKGKNAYAPAVLAGKFSLRCANGQFKHKGHCKSCPEGYKRFIDHRAIAGQLIRSGYCEVI